MSGTGEIIPIDTSFVSTWEDIPSSASAESPRLIKYRREEKASTGETLESRRASVGFGKTSTEPIPDSFHLDNQMAQLFHQFRDGFSDEEASNEFIDRLSSLVKHYGDAAISALAPFVIGNKASAETAAETLNCLSHMETLVSYSFRIWLIERALQAESSWIRDAATSGLEIMDDSSSIPYLQEAHRHESNSELQHYMESVLRYLDRKR